MDIDEWKISNNVNIGSVTRKTGKKLRKLNKCLELGCSAEYRFKSDLIRHLKFYHKLVMEYEEKSFHSPNDFNEWRSIYEEETNSQYVQAKTVSQTNQAVTYYNCNRSGLHRNRGGPIKLRAPKAQGSCKMGSVCPSHMIVSTNEEDKVTIKFWKTHYGHTDDVQHLRISAPVRARIAEQIADGVPMGIALGKLQEPIDDEIKRKDLITKRDLYNIANSFKLSLEKGQRNQDDIENVDLFVRDCQESCEENPVVCYKKQGDVMEGLNQSDFCLILMNSDQKEMLKEYGDNVVCIDSKLGINAHDFELTTVLVLDKLNEDYPVSFMYSNRKDNCILEFYFQKLKEYLNKKINPKYFLSDIKDKYYIAWEAVMGPSSNRLYSSWHVHKALSNSCIKIKSGEKRRLVLNACRNLTQITDISSFEVAVKTVVKELLDDPETKSFADYFSKHYLKNCPLWAKCYNQDCEINSNNLRLERLHKTIAYDCVRGIKTRRLDKSISNLLNYLKEKQEERFTRTEHGSHFQQPVIIFKDKHESMKDLENEPIELIDDGWIVSGYFITMKLLNNCCQLLCHKCDICVHRYACTCPDFQTNVIICKHIHYLLNVFRDENNYTFEIPTVKEECEIEIRADQQNFPEWNGEEEIAISVTSIESNNKEKLMKEIDDYFNSIRSSLSGLDEPALKEILKRIKALDKITTSLRKNKQIKIM